MASGSAPSRQMKLESLWRQRDVALEADGDGVEVKTDGDGGGGEGGGGGGGAGGGNSGSGIGGGGGGTLAKRRHSGGTGEKQRGKRSKKDDDDEDDEKEAKDSEDEYFELCAGGGGGDDDDDKKAAEDRPDEKTVAESGADAPDDALSDEARRDEADFDTDVQRNSACAARLLAHQTTTAILAAIPLMPASVAQLVAGYAPLQPAGGFIFSNGERGMLASYAAAELDLLGTHLRCTHIAPQPDMRLDKTVGRRIKVPMTEVAERVRQLRIPTTGSASRKSMMERLAVYADAQPPRDRACAELTLVYDSQRDGDSVAAWRRHCSRHSHTLTVMRTGTVALPTSTISFGAGAAETAMENPFVELSKLLAAKKRADADQDAKQAARDLEEQDAKEQEMKKQKEAKEAMPGKQVDRAAQRAAERAGKAAAKEGGRKQERAKVRPMDLVVFRALDWSENEGCTKVEPRCAPKPESVVCVMEGRDRDMSFVLPMWRGMPPTARVMTDARDKCHGQYAIQCDRGPCLGRAFETLAERASDTESPLRYACVRLFWGENPAAGVIVNDRGQISHAQQLCAELTRVQVFTFFNHFSGRGNPSGPKSVPWASRPQPVLSTGLRREMRPRGAWSGEAAGVARHLLQQLRQELTRRPEDAALLVRLREASRDLVGFDDTCSWQ